MITGPDISARRKSLGWSQEVLADKAGVCQAVVSMIERDKTNKVSVHLQNCVRQALSLELLPEDAPKPEPVPRPKTASKRGFASLSPERMKAIASQGGKAAHAQGVAHEFTPREAASANAKRASVDPETMRRIGRIGGAARKAAATARGNGLVHLPAHAPGAQKSPQSSE